MNTNPRLVIITFALTGLVSALAHPALFRLAGNFESGTSIVHGAAYLILINPSTLFTICVAITSFVLSKKGVLLISATRRALFWGIAASILAFPVGFVTMWVVAEVMAPQTSFGEYAFPVGLIVGGFALMSFCWITIRLVSGTFPRMFWKVSAVTVFGTIVITSAFNLLHALFDADMYNSLAVNDHWLVALTAQDFMGTLSLLIFGQITVGAVLGFWLVKAMPIWVKEAIHG